ncbi:SIR2 family protein [Streptomyces sp. NPDC051985]|uniref:SIR2 family protein n=1 Tax=Streptomyces sp. NPDC051985 TaxID=3155807 RepID=UPI00341443E4
MATSASKLGLNARDLKSARNAARGGEYNLLLGAGASKGARNSRGALPDAKGLIPVLGSEFRNAPISDSISLHRAYQRAVKVSSRDEVWRFLKSVFLGAEHDEWFQRLAVMPWSRVWTLNIDDAFENAFEAAKNRTRRRLRTVNFDDPFSETGNLEVVHLHGHVIGPDPKSLIFSLSEYQQLASEKRVWKQVLDGSLSTRPFVIIGASILGDPDVEAALLGSSPCATAPSIIVDPGIRDDNAWELEESGYRILRMTGEDFLDAWEEDLDLNEATLRELEDAQMLSIPQFSRLQTNRSAPYPRAHDYLGGDTPVWKDVLDGNVAEFEWMKEVRRDFTEWLEDDSVGSRLHIVYGRRLSGASSGLLLSARSFIRSHADVFIFDGSSRFDVDLVIKSCLDGRPTVLLIDSGADFANDVDELLNEVSQNINVRIYATVTEDPRNHLRMEGRLTGNYSRVVTRVPKSLGHKDSQQIVRHLEKFGRLGALEGFDHQQRVRKLKGRDIFSALVDVEYATGFRKRIQAEIKDLDAPWKKNLILLLALSAQEALQVGIMEASIAVGRKAGEIAEALELDGHLSALVEQAGDILVARQRGNAVDGVIDDVSDRVAFKQVLAMVQNLSPLATRASLRERNRGARLTAYLMTVKHLQNNFPKIELESEFFSKLHPVFGEWNGRFWEQRAIYAKRQRRWEKADSFAGRAVTLYDDVYTRTTHGTILVNRAQDLAESSDPKWWDFYQRGREQFETAIRRDRLNRVTAFAYLNATLALMEAMNEILTEGAVLPTSAENLHEVMGEWEREYAVLRLSLSGEENLESARRAEALSQRWASLKIKPEDSR